jgi:hypothetical protein
MPYVVRRTDGNVQIILQDGIVDASIGLYLVGRSFTGYGEFFADNFVRLLENFANDTAPTNPLEGQIYFNKSDKQFRYWNGNSWVLFARAGATGPTGPTGVGATGATGPVGDTGPSGPRGFTGSIGSVGPLGFTGSQGVGFTGSRGPSGLQGPSGATGPMGSLGFTGSRGATGPQGPTGFVGSRGPTGPLGSDGPKGDTGFTGSIGATGPGLTGNLSFVGQTINGTIVNNSITLNPLGTGSVVSNSKIIPAVNETLNLGDTSFRWQNVYTNAIRFSDGTSFSSGSRIIGATPPASSIGSPGDVAGKIAFDTDYFYYCFATFNATTNIWKRMPWSTGTW